MNLLLSIGDWFAQNWMILVLIVLAIVFLVPTYLRQKKENENRNELINTIKKGTKIVTTAGVYGVVESIENTTDGKVVTIVTGNEKNSSTMTIHINAIMGIDNKTTVAEENNTTPVVTKSEDKSKELEEAVHPKKTTAKKSTTTASKPTTKKTTK